MMEHTEGVAFPFFKKTSRKHLVFQQKRIIAHKKHTLNAGLATIKFNAF